ncbi:MAG: hypothetical protein WKF82_08775 [Nocardioidaceae bacterium]
MAPTVGERRASPVRLRLPPVRRIGSLLEPDLIDVWASPIGEHADAVCAGEQGFEVVRELLCWEVVIHVLRDVKGRDRVQPQVRDDADTAKPDYCTAECIRIDVSAQRNALA